MIKFAEVLESDPYKPMPATFASVFRMWREEGPLVHWPSGLPTLDEHTGGGLVFGSRAYLMGAPDAGKTALLIQLAHRSALQGMCVGLLAVDEEAGDVVTRFVQRDGWHRKDAEEREKHVLDHMAEHFAEIPVRFYDDSFTIESAAADLAEWAQQLGKRAFFGIDSIQTVRSEAGHDEDSEREKVTANVRAVRSVATQYRLLTVATCEMNRASYRSVQAEEQQNDMAAGKESGAIEYSARVLIALRNAKGLADIVRAKLVKNKLGRNGIEFNLQLDRMRQVFTETERTEEPELTQEQAAMRQLEEDTIAVYRRLREKQGPIKGGKTGFRAVARIMGVRADRVYYKLIEMGIITEAKLGKERVLEVNYDAIPVSPV